MDNSYILQMDNSYIFLGIVGIGIGITIAFFIFQSITNKPPASETQRNNRPPGPNPAPIPPTALPNEPPVWPWADMPPPFVETTDLRPKNMIMAQVMELREMGYPHVSLKEDNVGYLVEISLAVTSQIYLLYDSQFPTTPPQGFVAIYKQNEYSELESEELPIDNFQTISTWYPDTTLWKIVQEVEQYVGNNSP
jgi:hypothetical protein